MIEVTYLKSKEVAYTAIAIIFFVTAALTTLPYQSQVADAQPTTRYQFRVTLTDVPANAEDLEMNVTVTRAEWDTETVSSPSDGDEVRFVVRVPSGSNEDSFFVCGNTSDFSRSSCEQHSLPNPGVSRPLRVDYSYPSPL
jgi:hypothetical protein